jgi:hypothetical protein
MFLVQIYLSLPYSLQLGNSLGRHILAKSNHVFKNCLKRVTLLTLPEIVGETKATVLESTLNNQDLKLYMFQLMEAGW